MRAYRSHQVHSSGPNASFPALQISSPYSSKRSAPSGVAISYEPPMVQQIPGRIAAPTHLSLRFGQRTQVHSTLSSIACHL